MTESLGASSSLRQGARLPTLVRDLGEWTATIALGIAAGFLCKKFLFSLIRVKGRSMCPTLNDKEVLFVSILDVRLFGVARGDVVICRYPNRKELFVKRVVGVPGDVVERKNNVTYVQYEPLDEDRSRRYCVGSNDYAPYVLGRDEYFVVGDNRLNSHDSRHWRNKTPAREVGPISRAMLVGRVRFVLWPLRRRRKID
ncbi:MAG TPA: signal peptidase I [Candidatus Pullichristensenella excrementigallinarum]|uniref:Signal peptidase I n=1 Tax=Candidatus Pullichristensenella excrementigallinarum TaxID=2840907 RepID=A0A9D1IBQ2_9FIRM|nr:signal peptidase I [Candidatus Pullichristensenella excrementigallinarum]